MGFALGGRQATGRFGVEQFFTPDRHRPGGLDADTHLPVRKTFSWRDPVDKQRNQEEEVYDNYRPVQGLMVAYNFTRYFNGDMASERFLNSFSCNQGLNPAMFDPHSGYSPNKPMGKH